jgi:hypothetical protein
MRRHGFLRQCLAWRRKRRTLVSHRRRWSRTMRTAMALHLYNATERSALA